MSVEDGTPLRLRARRVLRDVSSFVAVLAVVVLASLFAWMTRQPDAAVFERMSEWAVVGPFIDRWRRPWLTESAVKSAHRARQESLERAAAKGAGERSTLIFLGGGVSLRQDPDESSPVLVHTQVIRQATVLGRQGSWTRVELRVGEDSLVGWVALDAPRDHIPPLGNDPLPPLPVAGRAPDADRLALALALLENPRSGSLGPYRLHHDLPDDSTSQRLLARLDRSAEAAEPSYRRHFGVTPVEGPAAQIVLFSERADYLRFQDQSADLRGLDSSGHVSQGLVAIWVEGVALRDVELTLLHEITHLLERRALGPALPPWLGEGMAEEFSELGFALENHQARAARLAEFRVDRQDGYELGGPLASLEQLLRAGGSGRLLPLEELLSEDWGRFVRGPDVSLRYAQSGWFLHWLLQEGGDPERRRGRGLRRFLAAVAEGETPSSEALRRELGAEWAEIDVEFRAWLAAEGVRAGL